MDPSCTLVCVSERCLPESHNRIAGNKLNSKIKMVSKDKRTSLCNQKRKTTQQLSDFSQVISALLSSLMKKSYSTAVYSQPNHFVCDCEPGAFWKRGESTCSWERVYLPRICGFNTIYVNNNFLTCM